MHTDAQGTGPRRWLTGIAALAVAVLGMPAIAGVAQAADSGPLELWRFGTSDDSKAEFDENAATTYDDSFTCDVQVGTTPLLQFPFEIRSSDANTGDVRYTHSCNSVDVTFTTHTAYNNVVLYYDRMGGELDYIRVTVDGEPAALIGTSDPLVDPGQNPPQAIPFLVTELPAGTHVVTITGGPKAAGEGTSNDGYHWVDAVWLVAKAQIPTSVADCDTTRTYPGFERAGTVFASAVGSNVSSPASGAPTVTVGALEGASYIIEASGTYFAGGSGAYDLHADAEYSQDNYQRANGLPWTDTVNNYASYGEGLLELTIDGTIVEWGSYSDDHVYAKPMTASDPALDFTFQVNDFFASNNTGGLCVAVFLDDEAPIVSNVAVAPGLAAIGAPVTVTANVDDSTTGGSNIASATFTVDSSAATAMQATDGTFDEVSEDVTGSFTPTDSGVYDVCVTGVDAAENTSDPVCTMLVVYDPSAGFVTGGGWIDSPEGAYAGDPSMTGKATFGFVSKYKKGASVPTGSTQFVFHAAGFNFHSDTQQWLVVNKAGMNAQFKGVGTVNGEDGYGFMIWATDGGKTSPDTFRIKIWDADETVVYDNGVEQEIAEGSIVVHIAK